MGSGQDTEIAARESSILERHFHVRECWFGKLAPQTATAWGEQASLNPYRAISGNGAFGSDANDEALLLGADDTPTAVGNTRFDAHRIYIDQVSVNTPCVLRVIFGAGTMADAEAAGQYSDVVLGATQGAGPYRSGPSPTPLLMPRLESETKVWARMKCATNDAWVDFFIGLHEYDTY